MNSRTLLLICSAFPLVASGCYKIEKLEDGKAALLNAVTGDAVIINKDGSAISIKPAPVPLPSPPENLMVLRTLTATMPESDDKLEINLKYRYRGERLEYRLYMEVKGEAFIVDALRKEGNSLSAVLGDAEGFELGSISLKDFRRIVDSKGEVLGIERQSSMEMSSSDFKRISSISPSWGFTPEFRSELRSWVLKTNANQGQSQPTQPILPP